MNEGASVEKTASKSRKECMHIWSLLLDRYIGRLVGRMASAPTATISPRRIAIPPWNNRYAKPRCHAVHTGGSPAFSSSTATSDACRLTIRRRGHMHVFGCRQRGVIAAQSLGWLIGVLFQWDASHPPSARNAGTNWRLAICWRPQGRARKKVPGRRAGPSFGLRAWRNTWVTSIKGMFHRHAK